MHEKKGAETLGELLQAIERSRELRSLARECGLTVRELRKRLTQWRRELRSAAPVPDPGAAAGRPARSNPVEAGPASPQTSLALPLCPGVDDGETCLADLPRADTLAASPLPSAGSPVLEVYTDGASRGNPGQAAVGVLFRQKNGPALCVHSETIGRATNNQAEYRAVLAALGHCQRWSVSRVHLFLDSELVVRQLLGLYRVKSPDLLPLYQRSMHLARSLREFRVRHLPRARNTSADRLANQALDAAERRKGSRD